jgi:small subunit ribosomal protein S17
VEISRTFRHPLYKKVVHTSHRVKAHDELGCQEGDQVQIVESRPLSRDKRWVVESIVKHGQILEEEQGLEVEKILEAEQSPEVDQVEAGANDDSA